MAWIYIKFMIGRGVVENRGDFAFIFRVFFNK